MKDEITYPLNSKLLKIGSVWGVLSIVSLVAYLTGTTVFYGIFLYSAALFALAAVALVLYLATCNRNLLITTFIWLLVVVSAIFSSDNSSYANYLASGFGAYDSPLSFFINPFFIAGLLTFVATALELLRNYKNSRATIKLKLAYGLTTFAVAYGLFIAISIEIIFVGLGKTS